MDKLRKDMEKSQGGKVVLSTGLKDDVMKGSEESDEDEEIEEAYDDSDDEDGEVDDDGDEEIASFSLR